MIKHNCSKCVHQFTGTNQIKFCGAFPVITGKPEQPLDYYQCLVVRKSMFHDAPTCPGFKPPTYLQKVWARLWEWIGKYMRGIY